MAIQRTGKRPWGNRERDRQGRGEAPWMEGSCDPALLARWVVPTHGRGPAHYTSSGPMDMLCFCLTIVFFT